MARDFLVMDIVEGIVTNLRIEGMLIGNSLES